MRSVLLLQSVQAMLPVWAVLFGSSDLVRNTRGNPSGPAGTMVRRLQPLASAGSTTTGAPSSEWPKVQSSRPDPLEQAACPARRSLPGRRPLGPPAQASQLGCRPVEMPIRGFCPFTGHRVRATMTMASARNTFDGAIRARAWAVPQRGIAGCAAAWERKEMAMIGDNTWLPKGGLAPPPAALVARAVSDPGRRLDQIAPLIHELVAWDLVRRTESGAFVLKDDIQQRLQELAALQPTAVAQVFVGRPCQRCGAVGVTRLVDGTRICAECQAVPESAPEPVDAPPAQSGRGRPGNRLRRYRKAG